MDRFHNLWTAVWSMHGPYTVHGLVHDKTAEIRRWSMWSFHKYGIEEKTDAKHFTCCHGTTK